ncbi:MAG: hypothetical protein R2883_08865 [Caldisericia bacterium]
MFKKEWIGLVLVAAGILLAVLLAFFDTFIVIGLVGAITVFALVMWKLEIGIQF